MKTLVVEDDFVSRELLQAILAPYGTVNLAVDGKEALHAVTAAWEQKEPYDLICLDIMLPEIDGFRVLREVRNLENAKGIQDEGRAKIIMTTALSDPRLVERAYAKNCEAYIIKPISKKKLVDTIRELGLI